MNAPFPLPPDDYNPIVRKLPVNALGLIDIVDWDHCAHVADHLQNEYSRVMSRDPGHYSVSGIPGSHRIDIRWNNYMRWSGAMEARR